MTIDDAARRVIRMECDRPGVGRLAHEILVAREEGRVCSHAQPRGKFRR